MMVSQREGRSVCKELPRCFTRTKRTGSHNESLHGISSFSHANLNIRSSASAPPGDSPAMSTVP
jgi:hypothetical protein